MLDNNITLFNIELPGKEVKNDSVVIAGVNASISKKTDVYSELEELSFSPLNSNDYGLSFMRVEICFENNFKEPYFDFYAACFSIRTDLGTINKLNGHPHERCFSKINKSNKVALGIQYYFRNETEIEVIKNCNEFCIEGCIAIGKKNNVYDIICRIEHKDKIWKVLEANTFRTHKKQSICGIFH